MALCRILVCSKFFRSFGKSKLLYRNSSVFTSSMINDDAFRQKLLEASLPFVKEYGWTHDALAKGAKSLDISPAAAAVFPDGPSSLALFFYHKNNEILDTHLASNSGSSDSGKLAKYIAEALIYRINLTAPVKETWPNAMLLYSHPRNASESLSLLRNLTDIIWSHTGNKTIDINWYTSRASLACLYKSAELVFLQDKTADLSQTRDFIERHSTNVVTFSDCAQKASDIYVDSANIFSGLCVSFANVIGMNR